MHSLIGIFIKMDKEEALDANNSIYPFKLIFPMNKARIYYCRTSNDRNQWVSHIKKSIGYAQVEDYYEIIVSKLLNSLYLSDKK